MAARPGGFELKADWKSFTPQVHRWVHRTVPNRIVHYMNELGRELQTELANVSPKGPTPSGQRARKRATHTTTKGYGPLHESWLLSETSSIDLPVLVVAGAFYAPFVEFGVHGPPQPMVGTVLPRIPRISQRVLSRVGD